MKKDDLSQVFLQLQSGSFTEETFNLLTGFLDGSIRFGLVLRGKSQGIDEDTMQDLISTAIDSILFSFWHNKTIQLPDNPTGYINRIVYNVITHHFLNFNNRDHHAVFRHVRKILEELENEGILFSLEKVGNGSDIRYGTKPKDKSAGGTLSYDELISFILVNKQELKNESGRWSMKKTEEIKRIIRLLFAEKPETTFGRNDLVKAFAHTMGIFEMEVEDVVKEYEDEDTAEEITVSEELTPEEETTYRRTADEAIDKLKAYLTQQPEHDLLIIREVFKTPKATLAQIAEKAGMKRAQNADYYIRRHSPFFNSLFQPIHKLSLEEEKRKKMILRLTDDIYLLITQGDITPQTHQSQYRK